MPRFHELWEGKDWDALVAKVEHAIGEARRAESDLEVEFRYSPRDGTGDFCTAKAPVDKGAGAVANALQQLAERTVGEAFQGEVRFNFRKLGDSSIRWGSWSRVVSGPGSPELPADAAASFAEMFRQERAHNLRMAEANSRNAEANAKLLHEAAALVAAANPKPAPPVTGRTAVDLFAQALGIAATADSKPAAGAAPAQQQAGATDGDATAGSGTAETGTSSPPAPALPGGQVPAQLGISPVTRVATEDEALAWVRANPERARQKAMELMSQGLI